MKKDIQYTGGAKIGIVNASWPLAKLRISSDTLKLKVFLIGKYEFTKDQITAIEKYTFIPVLGWGLKIRHNVSSYPEEIIFWSLGNPANIMNQIKNEGFMAQGRVERTTATKERDRKTFPLKSFPIVVLILIWNALLLYDFKDLLVTAKDSGAEITILGTPSLIAFTMLFVIAWIVKTNETVARMFLKPGRDPGEIDSMLTLALWALGFMSLVTLQVLMM